jgi:hypothetical protein
MINQAGVDTAAGISGIGKAATGAAQNYLDYTNFQKYLASRSVGGGLTDVSFMQGASS